MSDLLETLQQEGVDPALLEAVQQYRAAHALPDALRPRIPSPAFTYYGKEVWEQALAALLCGENLLLAGGKATGKNVLAENLAAALLAPLWLAGILIRALWNPAWFSKGSRAENILLWGSVAVLLLFGVLRNLPGLEFLLPSYLR